MSPLTDLLARAEWPDPAVDAEAVAAWPPEAVDRFAASGILAETTPATAVRCDACGRDHVEPVEWVEVPGRERRACITCPGVGIVWVPPGGLRRWAVRLPALASALAAVLGAGGVAECWPGRVWRLGTIRGGGRAWAGFLAAGLGRPDGADVVAAVPELQAPSALVFAPSRVPPLTLWPADRCPVVVPLADLLTVGPTGLVADREVLDSALAPVGRPAARPAAVVPVPAGATWEQVALTVEDRHLTVRVGGVAGRFGFAEAGFEDRRKRDVPDERWRLLTLLARFGGLLDPDGRVRTKAGSLRQGVTELRGRLRALVGIDADPFHPTARGGAYRTRFAIRAAGGSEFPTPPGATWEDVTLSEAGAGLILVAVATAAAGAAFVPADDPAAGGRWEATTEAGERRGRYALSDLGLGGPGGRPTAAGEALVAVLRAGGRVARPGDDPAMLRLGAALSRFLALDDPPFEFRPAGRCWVARFAIGPHEPGPDRHR